MGDYITSVDKKVKAAIEETMELIGHKKMAEARVLIDTATHISLENKSYDLYARCQNLSGFIYSSVGEDSLAMDSFLAGLECCENHKLSNLLPLFYNNIGSCYDGFKHYEKALTFYRKAAELLDQGVSQTEPRVHFWVCNAYINLANTHLALRQFDESFHYIELAEAYKKKHQINGYDFPLLLGKCRYHWAKGNPIFVHNKMDELIDSRHQYDTSTDYVLDTLELCDFLKDMKEYGPWEETIMSFETYAKQQNTIRLDLMVTELWMDYCKATNNMNRYFQLCIAHTDLSLQEKTVINAGRSETLDLKLQLLEKEQARRTAETASLTDSLTGIWNRTKLIKDFHAYRSMVHNLTSEKPHVAFGIIDIDCFKSQNDTFGHVYGDQCLKTVARVLSDCISSFGDDGDVYRYGGDEFIYLMQCKNVHQLELLAQGIKEQLAKISQEEQFQTPLHVSQGYYLFRPNGAEHFNDVFASADHALYEIKRSGKNGYHITTLPDTCADHNHTSRK